MNVVQELVHVANPFISMVSTLPSTISKPKENSKPKRKRNDWAIRPDSFLLQH